MSGFNVIHVTDIYGIFGECDSLAVIKSPINLTQECSLPNNGTWIRKDMKKEVTYLPDLTASIELINKELISYVITYELNGGNNHAENPMFYKEGETVTFKTPGKEGYKFAGWYDKSNNAKVASVKGKDITVYAKWKEKRTERARSILPLRILERLKEKT